MTPPSKTTSVLCSYTLSTMFPMIDSIISNHQQYQFTEQIQLSMSISLSSRLHFNKSIFESIINNNVLMKLQKLLEINLKLLPIKGQNHSSTEFSNSVSEAICRSYLLDNNPDLQSLANAFHEAVSKQQYTPQLLDWVNIFLFNVCAFNEERISNYDNQFLQSTQDYPQFSQKGAKGQQSTINFTRKMKNSLKAMLETTIALPFFQRIFTEAKPRAIAKSKSLRSLLETIDYISYKYEIKISNKEEISAHLSGLDRKAEISMILQRGNVLNKRIFSGAGQLVDFLNDIAQNYTVNLASIAELISANYTNTNPARKPFESAINSGEVITEEIIDFLIRKCSKGDLFSEKMDSYRPFELLMQILFQKFGNVLIEFNELIQNIVRSPHNCVYSIENYKQIQTFAYIFSYELESNYPRFLHLLKYTYQSLLAKYSQIDSLELMKKLILNRLFLNPFYYALLHSPSEQEMEKYVKIVNELRILFYERKMEGIAENFKSNRLNQLAELLRNSFYNSIKPNENQVKHTQSYDKGIYINDTLLGTIFYEITDNLKSNRNRSKVSSSEMQSESSLSFSLRNDSASRMQLPTIQNIPTISNHSLPHLPKPRPEPAQHRPNPPKDDSQRNTSKIISTDVYLEGQEAPVIDQLEELVSLRREYGELKRQIEVRTAEKARNRQNLLRQLHLLNNPVNDCIRQLSKSLSQHMINTFLL